STERPAESLALRGSTKLRDVQERELTAEERIQTALAAYELGTTSLEHVTWEALPGLPARRPLKLQTPQGTVVLKKIGETLEEARFAVSVIHRLADAGLPVPRLWARAGADANATDSYFVRLDSAFFLVESFVSGAMVDRLTARPEHWWAMGRALAQLHAVLGREFPEGQRTAPPSTDILAAREELEAEAARLSATPPAERSRGDQLLLDTADRLLAHWHLLRDRLPPDAYAALPYWVVHGDLNFTNLLFNEEGQIVAILDWERSRLHPRIEEFKNALMTVDPARGRTYDLDGLVHLVAAYQQATPTPLTEAELRAIPEILRATFLWEFSARLLLQRETLTEEAASQRVARALEALGRFERDFPGTEESVRRFLGLVQERVVSLANQPDSGGPRSSSGTSDAEGETSVEDAPGGAIGRVIPQLSVLENGDGSGALAGTLRLLDEEGHPTEDTTAVTLRFSKPVNSQLEQLREHLQTLQWALDDPRAIANAPSAYQPLLTEFRKFLLAQDLASVRVLRGPPPLSDTGKVLLLGYATPTRSFLHESLLGNPGWLLHELFEQWLSTALPTRASPDGRQMVGVDVNGERHWISPHKLIRGAGHRVVEGLREPTDEDHLLELLGDQERRGLQGWVVVRRFVLDGVEFAAGDGLSLLTAETLPTIFAGSAAVLTEGHPDDMALGVGALAMGYPDHLSLVTGIWDPDGVADAQIFEGAYGRA
ncbi:MAG TPA: phosphotransferase, partial [archaeon]|nr:phosphotransferase [archaeon]